MIAVDRGVNREKKKARRGSAAVATLFYAREYIY
jgi:hypothetical protein